MRRYPEIWFGVVFTLLCLRYHRGQGSGKRLQESQVVPVKGYRVLGIEGYRSQGGVVGDNWNDQRVLEGTEVTFQTMKIQLRIGIHHGASVGGDPSADALAHTDLMSL